MEQQQKSPEQGVNSHTVPKGDEKKELNGSKTEECKTISNLQNNRMKFHAFPLEARKFEILPLKKEFRVGNNTIKSELLYSVYTEKTLPQKDNFVGIKMKQTLDGLRILCINCDFSKDEGKKKPTRKRYFKTSPQERRTELMELIIQAMEDRVDFIVLQQLSQTQSRTELRNTVDKWNWNKNHKDIYYYPEQLTRQYEERDTLIISRHKVKFGKLRFFIEEHENQKENEYYLTRLSYCQFQMEGTKENICIISSHLRSNTKPAKLLTPAETRLRQLKCIEDFSKKFNRFFIIGDTNVVSQEEDKNIAQLFVDPVDIGQAQKRGTFLFRRHAHEIINERLDRVLMKKGNQKNTRVQINYRDDILLKSCKGKGWKQEQIFRENLDELVYITLTNHTILNISISFTQ